MKINSYLLNIYLRILLLSCISGLVLLVGCYSFTGGSVPEHLKTIYIASVGDNSGYGNPVFRDYLSQNLTLKFQNDNTLKVVDRKGDARLTVNISSINDQIQTVNPGELESERKVTVICNVEYYDEVKKKVIWNRKFSNFEVYDLANAQVEREIAVNKALEQTIDDILLAVVSGW